MKKIEVNLGRGIVKEPTPKFFNPYTESDMEKFYEIYTDQQKNHDLIHAFLLGTGIWQGWKISYDALKRDPFE